MPKLENAEILKRIAELEARQRHSEDRQAILDCIMLYTRAIDRHEWSLLEEVYHPDGIANHGDFVGDRAALRDFLEPMYHANYAIHTHHVMNHLCEIDGDVAHAETTALVMMALKDGTHVNMLGARYIDRFERRDGRWKIALRRIVSDFRCRAEQLPNYANFPNGRWDREDLSYERPVALPAALWQQVKRGRAG